MKDITITGNQALDILYCLGILKALSIVPINTKRVKRLIKLIEKKLK